ncbi:MAG TPA: tetratricopeptide repeat protein [Allosphingosinicella sp.]|nr:tetratricopeptide repeat protein [Allosphingosinicella sp.]
MASAWIELRGTDVYCSAPKNGGEVRFPLEDASARLRDWALRYDAASRQVQDDDLLAVGREMFAWLDESKWASRWCVAPRDRELEIRVPGDGNEEEAMLLDAPWELLATERGPLAQDPLQLFVVSRRVGPASESWQPHHDDLQLIFMAAAVEGQSQLDFEGEETAILKATDRGRTHLIVEETGALGPLSERLTAEGPFEALHLSCHGDIDPEVGPILLLETLEGDAHHATPGDLADAFGPSPPALVMLSACRTAERAEGFTAPFARQMATIVANVVGWDGSVYDPDATDFAAELYRELARRSSVPRAAAQGRRTLLQIRAKTPQRGAHWHLARVYLGEGGGGALCASGKPQRRRSADAPPPAFLDKARGRVPVASREAFVGRRRALQAILKAYRNGAFGVLIHGMGALGKSSAAARITNRLSRSACVIFERYDGLAIFDALLEMLAPLDRSEQRATWRALVQNDESALAEALESWLTGPFDAEPILLIIDDLERILENPKPGDVLTAVQQEYRAPLSAILKAFERSSTRSRLLFTSRYDFTLPDGQGGNIAAGLVRQQLIAMPAGERIKQLRAAERIAGREDIAADGRLQALLSEALAAGSGNPGLQAALTKPILGGELDAAEEALNQIAFYKDHGAPPAEIETIIQAGTARDSNNALIAFLARVSFQTYRNALTEDEGRQLAAATLHSEGVPIPRAALAAAGAANDCAEPERAIDRLIALGLLDDWGEIDGNPHAAANALARPLAPLDEARRPRLAQAAFPKLAAMWRIAERDLYIGARWVEAANLALEADAEPELLESAVFAGAAWLGRVNHHVREAFDLISKALEAAPADHVFHPDFLRLGVECATLLGEVGALDALFSRTQSRSPASDGDTEVAHAQLQLRLSERMLSTGKIAEAESLARTALETFRAWKHERMIASALGEIANIHYQRGQLDEAMQVYSEEVLPIYQKLGESREHAVVMGQIAQILDDRGERDEALRIHEEILLPTYRELGDLRAAAITMGRIAHILHRRGNTAEALRIAREEQLPVYEMLGDVRERATTMGSIGDILHDLGEFDEALRIRREEELPVLRALGDVRACAIIMGRIADTLEKQGELEEALRIRRQEELPVYEALGDVYSRAVTLQDIARLLIANGGLADQRIDEIYDALTEAFQLAQKLAVPDGIGFVGVMLAQVMLIMNLKQAATPVLDACEAAFTKLRDERNLATVRQLREQFDAL